jgi:hypothetical protein
MITLNISTNIIDDNLEEKIIKLFTKNNIECQLIKTKSSVKYSNLHEIENGFQIKMFKIEPIFFKEHIWSNLKKMMNLKCAFVKYDEEYMGCVLNWPNVFTNSNCIESVGSGASVRLAGDA